VLKSFNSSSIIISGNGTHLAPWHSKLGFKQKPSIPTSNSLTGQGGVVPLLFVTVHNIYPLEYVETTADGHVKRDQDEERAAQAEWQVSLRSSLMWKFLSIRLMFLQKRRAGVEAKLRDETCKTLERMEGLIDRLETLAGSSLARIQASEGMSLRDHTVDVLMIGQESPPDDIEAQVEDLEETEDQKSILKGLKPTTAAWMAVSLRQKYLQQQETMVMDIESELTVRLASLSILFF
jgi:breast cancer 2 susceptibility protein